MIKTVILYLILLTTGPSPLPKTGLQIVWSSAFCFKFQLVIFFLKLVGSCLPLLIRLLVPSIFYSITFLKRCFYAIWPIQLLYYTTTKKITTTLKVSVYCLFLKILTLGPVLKPCQISFKVTFKPLSYFLILSKKNNGIGKFLNKACRQLNLFYVGKEGFFPATLCHLLAFQEGVCWIELILSLNNST